MNTPGDPAAKPNRSTGVRDEVNSLGEVAREIEHYNLDASPPFNDSDTALRACAFLGDEVIMQAVSEAKDNFRKDDVRWQPRRARSSAKGSPQSERGGVHQFGVPPKIARRGSAFTKSEGTPQVASEARDNHANFARVQHFIHHLAPRTGQCGPKVQTEIKETLYS